MINVELLQEVFTELTLSQKATLAVIQEAQKISELTGLPLERALDVHIKVSIPLRCMDEICEAVKTAGRNQQADFEDVIRKLNITSGTLEDLQTAIRRNR